MEREIKFRGRTKDGEWRYGNLVQFADKAAIVSSDDLAKTPLDYVGAEIVKGIVEKDTVGQYTGFRDKNGEEIYDGDILYDNLLDCSYTVAYKVNGSKNEYPYISCVMERVEYVCSVAGNKWENPELIEGELI